MQNGFIKVATATPNIRVADCTYNTREILSLIHSADTEGVRVLTLPELCITGYTCADLFLQDILLNGALDCLSTLLDATKTLTMLITIGVPVRHQNKLYNCAVVCQSGRILGVVPKSHLPNYGEFQEPRWFAPAPSTLSTITLCGQDTLFGTKLLFSCKNISDLTIGVEICEDVWVSNPPSTRLAQEGATLILNLSASNDVVGKAQYRRQLLQSHSARLICGYLYASAGEGESSTDVVFGGHTLLCENGSIISESRFKTGLTLGEIDVQKLSYERRRTSTFPESTGEYTTIPFSLSIQETTLTRAISPTPFIPTNSDYLTECCEEILTIAALGLKKRLEHTHAKTAIVGLSGGLDSTLAILITDLALKRLGRPATDIIAITMPCFGTTDRTRDNATLLAELLGTSFARIDIGKAVTQHFEDINQPMDCLDVTFENAQARERTQVLMDVANQKGGLVIGTGDLSELALGWATYNGDHMSMYSVNGSIPKTLVRHLVAYVAQQSANPQLTEVLLDILDTPISPELLPVINGKMSQITEDLVGPYELHDFFLYYMVRWAFPPKKIYRLAKQGLGDRYSDEILLKWLKNFYRRFFSQQFKRSCLPDGPKVGTITFSPRGDWRMPSDALATLWMNELETL